MNDLTSGVLRALSVGQGETPFALQDPFFTEHSNVRNVEYGYRCSIRASAWKCLCLRLSVTLAQEANPPAERQEWAIPTGACCHLNSIALRLVGRVDPTCLCLQVSCGHSLRILGRTRLTRLTNADSFMATQFCISYLVS